MTLRVFIANNIAAINRRDKTHLAQKMTNAQVVETSVTVNNSPIHAGLRLPGRSYSDYLWNNDNNNNNNNNYNNNNNNNVIIITITEFLNLIGYRLP